MKDTKNNLDKSQLKNPKNPKKRREIMKQKKVVLIQRYLKGFIVRSQYFNTIYRYRKTMEIVDTEKSYYHNLNLIYNYYYNPLMKLAERSPILKRDEIKNVFSNILKVRESSSTVLEMLKKRMSVWQKKNQMIGDVFIKIMDRSLLVPYVRYIQTYDEIREYRNVLLQENAEFKKYLSLVTLLPPLEGKTFDDLMINPVQRIPRYLMLLDGLLKLTKSSHADHFNLINAKRLLSNFAEYINESIANDNIMNKLSSRLISYRSLPFNPDRKLLHHGKLKHYIKKSRKSRYLCLYTDYIVFSKIPRNGILRSKKERDLSIFAFINLNSLISVRPIGQIKKGYMFSINVSGQDNYFAAPTLNEMRYWTSQINLALKKSKKSSSHTRSSMILRSQSINIDKEEVSMQNESCRNKITS